MINIQQLQKIFKPIKYYLTKEVNYIQVHNNTHKKIIICIINDKDYNFLINQRHNICVRKNCLVVKNRFHNEIYIHEDYIKYIIRQKIINYFLND
jgi:hypothetical protein